MKETETIAKLVHLFKRRRSIAKEYSSDGYKIMIYPTKIQNEYYEKWKHYRNGNILELRYNEDHISLYINKKLKSDERFCRKDV